MLHNVDFFKPFLKASQVKPGNKNNVAFYIQISTVDQDSYVSIVDDKGAEIEINYQNLQGSERNAVHAIEKIMDHENFNINWETAGNAVSLNENEHLIPLLRPLKNIVDADFSPIHFNPSRSNISIDIRTSQANKTIYEGRILLNEISSGGTMFVLGAHYVLYKNQIFETNYLGSGFKTLMSFETSIKQEDLALYLSLLNTYLGEIPLYVEPYKIIYTQDNIFTIPALILQSIDEDQSLIMRVCNQIPNINTAILNQIDIHRYAELNQMDNIIRFKNVEISSPFALIEEIEKLLKKHTPSTRKGGFGEKVVLENDLFVVPKSIAEGFIYHELSYLLAKYQLIGAEKLKTYKINANPPKIKATFSSGIDFLEGEVNLEFGQDRIELFQALAQLKKQNYVLLSDGNKAFVNQDYIKKLQRIFSKNGKNTEVSFFDIPLVDELLEDELVHEQFTKSRTFYEGFNALEKKKFVSPKIKTTLRPYQENGYKWIQYLFENNLGGCLADDMGLGKTIQTIAFLSTIYPKEKKPTIIIMPRSLLHNWLKEISKFAPNITTKVYHSSDRNLDETLDANVILTTYAIARIDFEILKATTFYAIILDESQNIKNIEAKATKAVIMLKAEHRLALSGTPIENSLSELYSLFRFLNPGMFGSLTRFNELYATLIQKHQDKEAILHLRKKIYPFVLRRLKKDVLTELPDKTEQTLYVEMSEKQAKLYEQKRQFYKSMLNTEFAKNGIDSSRFLVFQALNELRQIATVPENMSDGLIKSPKLDCLKEQLEDCFSNDHKVLIFVNYLASVEHICQMLDEMAVDYVHMTGATRNRQELVDRFQKNHQTKAFVMTLKTGGIGLNLTAADTVFILDPWWNIAAENQAIDRVHRIGQKNNVLAYRLICTNTIEEKILELQQAKKELFDSVISSEGGELKSLSEEDINYILS